MINYFRNFQLGMKWIVIICYLVFIPFVGLQVWYKYNFLGYSIPDLITVIPIINMVLLTIIATLTLIVSLRFGVIVFLFCLWFWISITLGNFVYGLVTKQYNLDIYRPFYTYFLHFKELGNIYKLWFIGCYVVIPFGIFLAYIGVLRQNNFFKVLKNYNSDNKYNSSSTSGKFGNAEEANLRYLKKNNLIIPNKYIMKGWIALCSKDRHYIGISKLDRFRHTTVIAPSRQGKTMSVAIPRILDSQDSCFILDLKSELFQTTYEESMRKGKTPIALDPYKILDRYGDFPSENIIRNMNPLNPKFIDISDKFVLDEYVDSLTSSLLSNTKYENDHFQEAADAMIGALLENYIINKKTLVNLFDDFNASSYDKIISTLNEIYNNTESRRALSARGLLQKVDKKEGGGFLSTTFRSFKYLSSNVWSDFFKKEGFDFGELIEKKVDLYFIIPTRMAKQYTRVVRLLLNMFMINFELAVPKKLANRKFEVFIDEAGQIKCTKEIENIIEIYGEKGMCLTTFFQSINQIKGTFEKPGLILGADIVHIFGETDPEAVKWIQQRAGQRTIENHSYNDNESDSYNSKMSKSRSSSSGVTSSEIGTNLYHSNDISEMPFHLQTIFLRGYRSFKAQKIFYSQEPRYKNRAGVNYVEQKGLIEDL